MKIKLLVASMLLSAFTYQTALATNDASMSNNPATSNSAQQTNQKENDAAMLGWLVVLNKNEIEVSKMMLAKKDLNPMVKEYAQYLLKQHTQLLNETMNLSKKIKTKPMENEDAMNLKKEGNDGVAQLKTLNGMPLQKGFIDAMVKGHSQALNSLDDDLENNHDPKLKTLLQTTANHVKMHLEKAKSIQTQLPA